MYAIAAPARPAFVAGWVTAHGAGLQDGLGLAPSQPASRHDTSGIDQTHPQCADKAGTGAGRHRQDQDNALTGQTMLAEARWAGAETSARQGCLYPGGIARQ